MSDLSKALESADETRRLELGTGILERIPNLFRELFAEQRAVLVTDETIHNIVGEQVQQLLSTAGIPMETPIVFPDKRVPAEFGYVEKLEESLRAIDAIPIAVGAGTINDLTKLASHRVGRRYICVATAASMDGYTAFGASITHEGLKQTFSCPAPLAVIADIDLIRKAPDKMNAWGYADLLAKITAGADWLLADALDVEPIKSEVWQTIQGRLRELVADPAGVRTGDTEPAHHLTEGLLVAGFAMQAAKSSRPASGAEHQFSHLWDMQDHTFEGSAPSHGFKVGIGTLASTALYETIFEMPVEEFDFDQLASNWPTIDFWREKIKEWHGENDLAAGALREMEAKQPTREELRAQFSLLQERWPELKKKLQEQLIPFSELSRMLKAAGAPVNPEEIGISRARLRESFWPAFSIRRRFTVLDLAVRLGVLDDALAKIFDSEGSQKF